MSLRITPEVEASMRETEAQIRADMQDPSFRAEFEATSMRYKLLESFEALIKKPGYVRMLSKQPKRQHLVFNISFGGGEPAEIVNRELSFV